MLKAILKNNCQQTNVQVTKTFPKALYVLHFKHLTVFLLVFLSVLLFPNQILAQNTVPNTTQSPPQEVPNVASKTGIENAQKSAKTAYAGIRADFHLGVAGIPGTSVFAVDTLERFGNNWRSLQVPLANGLNYEQNVTPFFALTFLAGYKNFSIEIEAPLRKDIEAWYDSEWKENFTINPSELDINVPNKAFARYDNDVGFVQFGRFKPELGPSEHTLSLSGFPNIDALWWSFSPSIFRYDFLFVSLNAWLHGDIADSGCPPEGTEAQLQKCPDAASRKENNARGRVYNENYKNLVYHRLGIDIDFLWISFTEMSMIGGKAPEWRTISPFILWHNNFASGYTKSAVLFEVGARPAKGTSFYGQIHIEDIKSPVGETGGASTRSILSYLVGYSDTLQTNWGKWAWQFEVVRTDPAYNQGHLPLLAYTNRKMYRSNYREQDDIDFADMFYVDYPIGYSRGPDALDIWLSLLWEKNNQSVKGTFGFLRQGDKELYYDNYDNALSTDGVLSGIVETQLLGDILYRRQALSFLEIYGGFGGRYYKNLEHEKNKDGKDFWIRLGAVCSFEFFYRK